LLTPRKHTQPHQSERNNINAEYSRLLERDATTASVSTDNNAFIFRSEQSK